MISTHFRHTRIETLTYLIYPGNICEEAYDLL